MRIAASNVSLSSSRTLTRVSASKTEDVAKFGKFTLQGLQDATKDFQGSKNCGDQKENQNSKKSKEIEAPTEWDISNLLMYDVTGRRVYTDGSLDQNSKDEASKEASEEINQETTLEDPSNTKQAKEAGVVSKTTEQSPIDILRDIRLKLLYALIKMLGGEFDERYDTSPLTNILQKEGGVQFETYSSTTEYYYSEVESSTVEAKGVALTEDGRTIDFGVSLSMSRAFESRTSISVEQVGVKLMDPLVINVSGDVQSISDQKFVFDLDADGQTEDIHMLKKGSGFLALDRNDDGVINDGSELFGAKSGDGFSDLSEFDLDRNGWIDENDEIYDKLRVWAKNDDGTDTLITLKEADVGAIYLQNVENGFQVKNSMNDTNAVYHSTGVFLHEESGRAGFISHVDMAVRDVESA